MAQEQVAQGSSHSTEPLRVQEAFKLSQTDGFILDGPCGTKELDLIFAGSFQLRMFCNPPGPLSAKLWRNHCPAWPAGRKLHAL